jgi:hypothetical protein
MIIIASKRRAADRWQTDGCGGRRIPRMAVSLSGPPILPGISFLISRTLRVVCQCVRDINRSPPN